MCIRDRLVHQPVLRLRVVGRISADPSRRVVMLDRQQRRGLALHGQALAGAIQTIIGPDANEFAALASGTFLQLNLKRFSSFDFHITAPKP